MAIQASYTLDDIIVYAQKNCQLKFAAINNPDLYNVQTQHVKPKDGEILDIKVIQIGFWVARSYEIRVWMSTDGANVQYYRGKIGEPLTPIDPPFPDQGRSGSNFNSYKAPFSWVVRPLQNRTEARQDARRLVRTRLALLAKYAFLRTGHIAHLQNNDHEDLLLLFKELCVGLQQNTSKDNDHDSTSVGHTAARVSKRKSAVDDESSTDELLQSGPKIPVQPRARQRQPSNARIIIDFTQPEEVSMRVPAIFNALSEQSMAKTVEEWTEKK